MTTRRHATLKLMRGPEGAPPPPNSAGQAQDSDPLGEVFAVVSHDLRDPLSAIVMGAQLLLGSAQDDRTRRVLEAIARAGDRMNLVLRNASTLRARQLELRLDAHRAENLLAEACTKLERLAARKSVQVEVKLDVGEAVVTCDGARIEEVLLLLGDNAVRHANGRPVLVSAHASGTTLDFTVADGGAGIPKERLATIFDWHVNARQPLREGTGLGLASARRIVEAHQGSIDARSKVGHGSTFQVSIPLAGPVPRPLDGPVPHVKADARRPHR